MLFITVYSEGPSCLPSQTVEEKMTSDCSNSEELPLGAKRSRKCRKQSLSQPRNSRKTLHQCPHCPYSTKDSGNMQRYIRTHTGEKPYSCEVCGQCFAQSSNHNIHLYRKHFATRAATDKTKVSKKLKRIGCSHMLERNHTRVKHVGSALLHVEVVIIICVKYIMQLMKRLLSLTKRS